MRLPQYIKVPSQRVWSRMYIRPPDAARPFLLDCHFLGCLLCHVASRMLTAPSVPSRTVKDSAVVVIGVDRRGVGSDNSARQRLPYAAERGCQRSSRARDFRSSARERNAADASIG